MVKAEDWDFDKYIPNLEDLKAIQKERERWFRFCDKLQMNPIEESTSSFDAGFWRGLTWCMAKHDIKKKVKDKVNESKKKER
jgi:hypothetical protein